MPRLIHGQDARVTKLAAPGGFADHERRHLLGADVLHIGFDAASTAGEDADRVLDLAPGLLD